MQKSFRSFGLILALAAGLALSACGGGGGDGIGSEDFYTKRDGMPPPTNTPTSGVPTTMDSEEATSNSEDSAGIWTGRTSTGRDVIGLLQDDGSYWVLYSRVGNAAVVAGAVQGTSTSIKGVFVSENGLDFGIESGAISQATIDATYVPKSSLKGSVIYSGGTKLDFDSIYDPAYERTVSLASLAGRYTGTAAVARGVESASLTIDSAGDIVGSSVSGCSYTGTAALKAKGAAFSLSITFDGGNCANGTSTINGVGYLDTDTGRLYGMALNSNRTNGMIFTGTKS